MLILTRYHHHIAHLTDWDWGARPVIINAKKNKNKKIDWQVIIYTGCPVRPPEGLQSIPPWQVAYLSSIKQRGSCYCLRVAASSVLKSTQKQEGNMQTPQRDAKTHIQYTFSSWIYLLKLLLELKWACSAFRFRIESPPYCHFTCITKL